MKLLLCLNCQDLFRLTEYDRVCSCGETQGRYALNGVDAVYAGDHAVPLGLNNLSLVQAMKNRPLAGMGERFEAFVIPRCCPTFVRNDKAFPKGAW